MLSFSLMVGLPAFAQGPGQNVAVTYPVNEESVQSGDIIGRERRTGNLRFTRVPNSREMFGVVTETPSVVFQSGDDDNDVAIIRSGQVLVNVTNAGGEIESGDIITSSYVPGYGRKASEEDQYQLGIALEPFSGEGATSTIAAGASGEVEAVSGQILVDLGIGPIEVSGEDDKQEITSLGFLGNADPVLIAKILIAGLIAVGAIYSSFQYFGSSLTAGVSSVGRNPMAKTAIRRMVLMNLIAILLISFAGIGLSVLVLFLPV